MKKTMSKLLLSLLLAISVASVSIAADACRCGGYWHNGRIYCHPCYYHNYHHYRHCGWRHGHRVCWH